MKVDSNRATHFEDTLPGVWGLAVCDVNILGIYCASAYRDRVWLDGLLGVVRWFVGNVIIKWSVKYIIVQEISGLHQTSVFTFVVFTCLLGKVTENVPGGGGVTDFSFSSRSVSFPSSSSVVLSSLFRCLLLSALLSRLLK